MNPIANIFYAAESEEAINILLGMRLLWLLDSLEGSWISRSTIVDYLRLLGHKDSDIDGALHYFELKEITRPPQTPKPDHYFGKSRICVNIYLSLSGHLAYLDNMAMVTPVRSSRLERMSITRSNTQFMKRKQTTLEFLDEIREVEAEWFAENGQGPSVGKYLGVDDVPSVFMSICESYRINAKRSARFQKSKYC